jgi:hypothetical protein
MTQYGTYMTFMNCSTEKQIYSRHILKTEEETHHKVDPKEERVRRVEARAASEPFRTKRHPAVIEKGKKGSALPVITITTIIITIRHPGFRYAVLFPTKKKIGINNKHVPAI